MYPASSVSGLVLTRIRDGFLKLGEPGSFIFKNEMHEAGICSVEKRKCRWVGFWGVWTACTFSVWCLKFVYWKLNPQYNCAGRQGLARLPHCWINAHVKLHGYCEWDWMIGATFRSFVFFSFLTIVCPSDFSPIVLRSMLYHRACPPKTEEKNESIAEKEFTKAWPIVIKKSQILKIHGRYLELAMELSRLLRTWETLATYLKHLDPFSWATSTLWVLFSFLFGRSSILGPPLQLKPSDQACSLGKEILHIASVALWILGMSLDDLLLFHLSCL